MQNDPERPFSSWRRRACVSVCDACQDAWGAITDQEPLRPALTGEQKFYSFRFALAASADSPSWSGRKTPKTSIDHSAHLQCASRLGDGDGAGAVRIEAVDPAARAGPGHRAGEGLARCVVRRPCGGDLSRRRAYSDRNHSPMPVHDPKVWLWVHKFCKCLSVRWLPVRKTNRTSRHDGHDAGEGGVS